MKKLRCLLDFERSRNQRHGSEIFIKKHLNWHLSNCAFPSISCLKNDGESMAIFIRIDSLSGRRPLYPLCVVSATKRGLVPGNASNHKIPEPNCHEGVDLMLNSQLR